jgi:pyrroline-5-carboxylate reductase
MSVLVLGAGKMVGAILRGLRNSGVDLSDWTIFSPSGVSANNLAHLVGAKSISNLNDVSSFSWVLLGCKPQQLHEVKELIGNKLKDQLFVSLLAAVPEEDQIKTLQVKSLIRMMPNLPVEYNSGVILLSSISANSKLQTYKSLFSVLGEVMVVNDEELEELTLLTGSGPALFYEFALSLSRSFKSLGVTERELLSSMVLRGAGVSINKQRSLQSLIDSVTSKGGVTKAVLDHWREGSLQKVVDSGTEAGKLRAKLIKDSLRN